MTTDDFARFTVSDIMHAIETQTCPDCGAGPFRNLALHFQRTHGVTAGAMKEMFGLNRHTSLASTEFAEKQALSQRAAMKRDPALGRLRLDAIERNRHSTGTPRRDEMRRHTSAASLKQWETVGADAKRARIMPMVERSLEVRMADPVYRREAGERLGKAIAPLRADQGWLDTHLRHIPSTDWEYVARRYEGGESQGSIARDYHTSQSTVSRVYRNELRARQGIVPASVKEALA